MKNKNSNHHLSIHQKLERLAHHQAVLSCILSVMALGLLKYETQAFYVLQNAYYQGFGMASVYAHHDEITRMPVQYGRDMRTTLISGQ
jgi:hypothetical protein